MRTRKQHHEEHADETWLIPYSDLLTLLLALFIILFASSHMDQKKFDQLRQSLSVAFNGGTGILNQSSQISITDTQSNPQSQQTKQIQNNPQLQQLQQQQSAQNQIQNNNGNSFVGNPSIQQETTQLNQLKDKLNQYIKDNQLTTQLTTMLTDSYLLIRIRDHALFASGSAQVKPDAENLANAVSQLLSQYPNYKVQIAGYTDNVPIHTAEFPSNWDLSTKRALNFMKLLLADSQMDPSRYSAVGYGQYHPIASNKTEDGRSQNRRVEIYIYRNAASQGQQVTVSSGN